MLKQNTIHTYDIKMANRYSNWTLKKCDQCFDKYFQRFETRKINNRGMSVLRSEIYDWIPFRYIESDQSFTASSISSTINSLNIKIWYRLNRNTIRGEICVRNIQDDISTLARSGNIR